MNDPSARAVHDHDAGFHRSDGLGVDETFRFRRQRRMDGNDVRPPEEFGKVGHLHAHLLGAVGSEVWIVGNHAHADALGKLRQMAADLTHADDP